jgi:hypothetical protein
MSRMQIPTQRDFRNARRWAKEAGITTDEPTFSLNGYVSWLNAPGVAVEDFRKLTELTQAMARLEIPLPDVPITNRNRLRLASERISNRHKAMLSLEQVTQPICRRIAKKYPTFSSIVGSRKAGGVPFFERVPLREDLRGTWDLQACYAFGYLERIINAGVLGRIGRCKVESCRRYFHGRIGKLFCSDKCLRKHLRQTPQFKKRNREDQRNHYDKIFGKTKRWRAAREARKREGRTSG